MYDTKGNPLTNPPTTFEERMEAGDAWLQRAIHGLNNGYVNGSSTAAGIAAAFFASAAAIKPPAASND